VDRAGCRRRSPRASDLRDALDTTPGARRHWDVFPRSTKRAILEWIGNAKTPATRTKRIIETTTKAAQNLRANQWRQPKSATTQPLPARPAETRQDTG
jgi:Bacteriocin-protection, YdeI or OmpD-Associated